MSLGWEEERRPAVPQRRLAAEAPRARALVGTHRAFVCLAANVVTSLSTSLLTSLAVRHSVRLALTSWQTHALERQNLAKLDALLRPSERARLRLRRPRLHQVFAHWRRTGAATARLRRLWLAEGGAWRRPRLRAAWSRWQRAAATAVSLFGLAVFRLRVSASAARLGFEQWRRRYVIGRQWRGSYRRALRCRRASALQTLREQTAARALRASQRRLLRTRRLGASLAHWAAWSVVSSERSAIRSTAVWYAGGGEGRRGVLRRRWRRWRCEAATHASNRRRCAHTAGARAAGLLGRGLRAWHARAAALGSLLACAAALAGTLHSSSMRTAWRAWIVSCPPSHASMHRLAAEAFVRLGSSRRLARLARGCRSLQSASDANGRAARAGRVAAAASCTRALARSFFALAKHAATQAAPNRRVHMCRLGRTRRGWASLMEYAARSRAGAEIAIWGAASRRRKVCVCVHMRSHCMALALTLTLSVAMAMILNHDHKPDPNQPRPQP